MELASYLDTDLTNGRGHFDLITKEALDEDDILFGLPLLVRNLLQVGGLVEKHFLLPGIKLAALNGRPGDLSVTSPEAVLSQLLRYYVVFPAWVHLRFSALAQRITSLDLGIKYLRLPPPDGSNPLGDDRRLQYASTQHAISTLLSLVVLFHEIGHIKNGHLLLLQERGGTPSRSIVERSSEVYMPDILSLPLEFDADAFSAAMLLSELERLRGGLR